MTEHPKPPSAFASLSTRLLDLLTPAGRGKRIDATFTDPMGERKRRIDVVTEPRPAPKRPRRKP